MAAGDSSGKVGIGVLDLRSDVTRKRFIYGLVLSAVSLWREFDDREDRDELIGYGMMHDPTKKREAHRPLTRSAGMTALSLAIRGSATR